MRNIANFSISSFEICCIEQNIYLKLCADLATGKHWKLWSFQYLCRQLKTKLLHKLLIKCTVAVSFLRQLNVNSLRSSLSALTPLPGHDVMFKYFVYSIYSIIIWCKIPFFSLNNPSKGLGSVLMVGKWPYRNWWNFLTPKIMTRASFSSVK